MALPAAAYKNAPRPAHPSWAELGYAWLRSVCVTWLVLSVGMQWAVTQSAGWLSMMVTYAQQGTMLEALEKTFDGEHPCELCALAAKQSSETDNDSEPTVKHQKVKKAEIPWEEEPLLLQRPDASLYELPEKVVSWTPWQRALDKPPPRLA